jgi:hypothetical protein
VVRSPNLFHSTTGGVLFPLEAKAFWGSTSTAGGLFGCYQTCEKVRKRTFFGLAAAIETRRYGLGAIFSVLCSE